MLNNTRLPIMLIALFIALPGHAADEKPKPGQTLCDKQYGITSADGRPVTGSYAIKAVERDAKVEIQESFTIESRGIKIAMTSTVTYDTKKLLPAQGTAETWVDGKPSMKGKVTFAEKTFAIYCTGHLNLKTGEPVVPPTEHVKKDQPVAEGVLLFQSAFTVIAPRLLPREGELDNVVFIEFPDDIAAPELMHAKAGYRLVREKADDQGRYDMKIFSPHSPDSIAHARFNKDNQLVAYLSFGKFAFVKTAKEK